MTRLLSHISILVLIVSWGMNSCSPSGHDTDTAQRSHRFAYDLTSPDADYELPDILREISGISWYGNNKIACIQDEQAVIYIFDEKKGEISDSYSFG